MKGTNIDLAESAMSFCKGIAAERDYRHEIIEIHFPKISKPMRNRLKVSLMNELDAQNYVIRCADEIIQREERRLYLS